MHSSWFSNSFALSISIRKILSFRWVISTQWIISFDIPRKLDVLKSLIGHIFLNTAIWIIVLFLCVYPAEIPSCILICQLGIIFPHFDRFPLRINEQFLNHIYIITIIVKGLIVEQDSFIIKRCCWRVMIYTSTNQSSLITMVIMMSTFIVMMMGITLECQYIISQNRRIFIIMGLSYFKEISSSHVVWGEAPWRSVLSADDRRVNVFLLL